jgi:wyosine [tRNA(Phe)-imidazoG37] synthetase (radical SAM superfamily)
MITFGPLQSRRLGRSLGVNNIPTKRCSYSCIYCQVGPTRRRSTKRRKYSTASQVVDGVSARVELCRKAGEPIDYVTFVPSGEPTLDANLGSEIRAVRRLGHPVAVLTNGSLLTRPDVRVELMAADLVSVKVDSVDPKVWKQVNRPAAGLDLTEVREGILQFSRHYTGRLLTESMILRGINDDPRQIHRLAHFLARVDPYRAYLTTPVRAPATSVESPSEQAMARLFTIVASHVRSAGLLLAGYPLMLAGLEDAAKDLLSTVTVHPLCEESVAEYLEATGQDWKAVDDLIDQGALRRTEHDSKVFFVRGHDMAEGCTGVDEDPDGQRGHS